MDQLSYKRCCIQEIIDTMPNIIKWFDSYGINSTCTRYTRYLNYINDYFKRPMPSLSELNNRFEIMTKAFQECTEVYLIYKQFEKEKSEGFIAKLEKINNGLDFLDTSVSTTRKDFSRDFLYELLIAAKYKGKGYEINFDSITDVYAKKDDDIFLIECKRLKSLDKLEKNLRKAGKQLKRAKSENSYGFIYVDIYNCVSNSVKSYEYSSVYEMNEIITLAVENFYEENRKIINAINDSNYPYSLGLCLSIYKCLWLSNCEIQFFDKQKINTSNNITDNEWEKVKKFASLPPAST